MKIDGTGKTGGVKGPSKTGAKKAAGDSSFSGMIDGAGAADAQKPVSGVMSVSAIDALLSVQEAGDGASGPASKRARARAEALLEQLEQVRIGLLGGGIPVSTLRQLTQTLNARRETVMDPQLNEILDEIDLRAQVELAKYETRNK